MRLRISYSQLRRTHGMAEFGVVVLRATNGTACIYHLSHSMPTERRALSPRYLCNSWYDAIITVPAHL